MAGIYVTNGATPDELGLPGPPSTVTEDPSCQLKGYGPGCAVPVDRDSLTQQIWTLAFVAFRAGCTPKCGTTESDVGWLADAIEKLICQNLLSCEPNDPSDEGVVTSTSTTCDADGNKVVCTTTLLDDNCPPFHVNTVTGCFWVFCKDTGWVNVSKSAFHFGPCSDYANENIPTCATVWVQEDACRHVFRHGDFWVEEGGPGLTFAPAPAAAFPYWTNGQVVTDQYGKERSYDQACNTLAIAAQGTGVLTDNGDCTFTYDDGNGNVSTDGDPVTIDIGACAGGGLDYDEHPNAHTWAAVGGPGPVGSQFNQVLTRFKANVGDPWQYNWVPIVGSNDDP